MIRSSRLRAAMLAALFAALLAVPAYATTKCYRPVQGTKFNDLNGNGKRDSGEPGLAGWRIWADYDDDGVRDTGEPYDDTDSSGKYSFVVTRTASYKLREQRPGGGTGGWKCSYPNASTSGGFASGKGGDFGCGWGPISADSATGKDFGNYKQPKITVIKKLVPASDCGSGSTLVNPGAHLVSETAAAGTGTDLADYSSSIACDTATSKTYGPGWVHPQSGDEITCTITNTRLGKVEIAKVTDPHETGGTQFGFTGFAGAFDLADGGVKTITRVAPSSTPYAVTESAASGYRLSSITCNDGDSSGAVSTRTASIKVGAGETVRCTFVNTKLHPGIEVVKSGPAVVHHGDKMDFSFAVRSIGNTPLHDIKVSDDKCSPVSADPVTKAGGDLDALLEDGEVWTYTCSMTVPTHSAGEMDPLCNVVTAAGEDEQDNSVSDTDRHCTDIIHPAIKVKKTADRATAQVGDTIGYQFDVTNPGDTGLTVTLSDARCDASTLKGPQKLAGNTDDLLEPDEQWRYTCTHKITASDPDPLPNTVHVTGTDKIGGPSGTVEDEDSAVVDLTQPTKISQPAPPQQQVLADEEQSTPHGRAHLAGPSGCVYKAFNATVRGRQIRRVTFFLDGRRIVIRKAKSGQRTFKARIRPGRLSVGVHRVTARVVFRTASRTRARTLVLSFQHCARLATSPRFTG
jgi:hypothetical protein